MAHTVVTRIGENHCNKLLSQKVIDLGEIMRVGLDVAALAAGNYLVAYLPANCVVQNSYLFTTKANSVVVDIDVGTTEGGLDILDSAAGATLGATGTPGAKLFTGTGKNVFVKTSAILDGEHSLVIEYLELDVKTGSMTRM